MHINRRKLRQELGSRVGRRRGTKSGPMGVRVPRPRIRLAEKIERMKVKS